jgi:starch synthase/alpha-amylase
MENWIMLKPLSQPRILFVTTEVTFIPNCSENANSYIAATTGRFSDNLEGLIIYLYGLGADVHVVQPDYRQIFTNISEKKPNGIVNRIPADRVHLTEDRVFFYSNYTDLNHKLENIKISIAFQREVINHVIPEVEPDLIHCHDWMTGLIPAAAKKLEIPCLFTIQNPETSKSSLSFVEDIGIDAADFWQHLFYDRYPMNYEETRESNPIDLLLSGIFSADFVDTSNSAFLAKMAEKRSSFTELPIWRLVKKKNAFGVVFKSNFAKTQQYIYIYERMLQRSLLQPEQEKFGFDSIALT